MMRRFKASFLKASLLKAVAQSLILFLSFSSAAAQVAGPKDLKKKQVPKSASQTFEKEGVKVDFSIKSLPDADGRDSGLVAGANAVVSFRVTDKRTNQPITNLHPVAWFSSRNSDREPNEAECKDRIRTFMGGLLSVRPDVDLNKYVVLTLNHDRTVTFINPQIAFNVTKLESIVPLPAAGVDWVLSKNKDFLYLTMPGASAVAVINTVTRKLVDTISTGEKTKPMRIALQPDGKQVWVGLDGSPSVAVIDARTNKLAGHASAGDGLHNIAFTGDSRLAFVTNSASNTVTAVDTNTLTKLADISVGKTPVPVAYSGASGFVYVAAINDAAVSVINPANLKVIKTVRLARGVVALRFDPTGRYGFAVNQVESNVSVIDASTDQVVATAQVAKGPDQVTFTDRYAYIRATGSERFSLIELGQVAKKGSATPISIQAGRQSPDALAQEITVSDMIRPTPEGNAVVIANTPDMMLYYYTEGMMAPMGTLQNYKRRPHALLVLDRSLHESEPGVYTSAVKLTSGGRFDVPMLIDQPRVVKCFAFEIAGSPDGQKNKPVVALSIEHMFKEASFKSGEAAPLRFKITDPVTKQAVTGLEDVQVLIFEPPGIWQQRLWAKEVGDGVYEAAQVFPRAAVYNVMVRVESRAVRFNDFPHTALQVVDGAEKDKKESKN
jgi:YVTN family beta-propeller protein